MADTYRVERSIEVSVSASALYERIVDLHRWSAWSPYEGLDPHMTRTYRGPESGVGAVYEWSGNMKAGTGCMEIIDAVSDQHVSLDLRFSKPFRSSASAIFVLSPTPEGTRVTWTMTGPLTGPTRLMGVFRSMDKMVGPQFEKGLAQLKADAEGAATPAI